MIQDAVAIGMQRSWVASTSREAVEMAKTRWNGENIRKCCQNLLTIQTQNEKKKEVKY